MADKNTDIAVSEQANATQALQAATIAEEEKKKNALLEALRNAFKFLRQMFLNRKATAGIMERMDEIQKDIEYMAAQGELNSEQLEKLCEITGDIVERSKIVTPENFEEIIQQTHKDMNLLEEVYKSSLDISKVGLAKKIIQRIEDCGVEVPDKLKKSLPEDMRIINHGDGLKNNELLIEWEKAVQKVTFSYEKENGQIKPTLVVSDADVGYGDIYDENGNLNEGYSYTEKDGLPPEHSLMIAFCEQNKINYYFDKKEEVQKFKENICNQRARFLTEHMDKATVSDNGRNESQFFAADLSFRVRDKRTGDLIVFKPNKKDDTLLEAFLYKDAESLMAKGKSVLLGSWSAKEGEKETARLNSQIISLNVGALLQSSEVKEYLVHNGFSEKFQNQYLNAPEKPLFSKVSKAGMEKVNELRNKVAEINASRSTNYTVSYSDPNAKYMFLNISGDEGKDLSVSFNKAGKPQSLCYRKGYGEKHKYVCDADKQANRNGISPNYAQLREDKDFTAMFNIMTEAIGGELHRENSKRMPQKQTLMPETHELEDAFARTAPAMPINTDVHGKALEYALDKDSLSVREVQAKFKLKYSEAFKVVQKLEDMGAIERVDGADNLKPIKGRYEFEKMYADEMNKAEKADAPAQNKKQKPTERG